MINVKLIKMREQAKTELENIPRGDLKQNMLRQNYFICRMSSLGKKAQYPDDKNKVLKIVIDHLKEYWKKQGQEFRPQYDKKYFTV